MHPLKKAFFVALGCISLALGTIGIALPILPTVPFYLLTAFCFANSSERLHTWSTHTTVYKKYIGSYFRRRGMIFAFDVEAPATFGRRFYREALARELLLRPMGNTVYFMPPYVITAEQCGFLVERAADALEAALKQ